MVKLELLGPDGEVETPWATPTGPDLYRLENSPFFAYACLGLTSSKRGTR